MNRRARLVVSLLVAGILSVALGWVALAGDDVAYPVVRVADLDQPLDAGKTVQLEGIARAPIDREGETLTFTVSDDRGKNELPIRYEGSVPDAFRSGRTVVVTGAMQGDTFVAKPGTLVTKCPSKFQSAEDA